MKLVAIAEAARWVIMETGPTADGTGGYFVVTRLGGRDRKKRRFRLTLTNGCFVPVGDVCDLEPEIAFECARLVAQKVTA